MATAGVINGKLIGVYVDGTLVATAKSCKVSITHEARDTFSKDDSGWKTVGDGARGWKMDVDGLVNATSNSFSTLFTLVTNRTEVTLSFQSSVIGDKHYRGRGYITSLDQSADNEASATYSASFDGDGVLTEGTLT
jgi:predicted secreted protein